MKDKSWRQKYYANSKNKFLEAQRKFRAKKKAEKLGISLDEALMVTKSSCQKTHKPIFTWEEFYDITVPDYYIGVKK